MVIYGEMAIHASISTLKESLDLPAINREPSLRRLPLY